MIGETVSHYRIEDQLGSGGMGVVYRAVDTRLGRPVALKFVSEHVTHVGDAVDRLRAEARAASALNHPNICTIYDIGEVNGHPFIVMELLKGRSLRDLLDEGPLKPAKLVDLAIEIADALNAAHAEGIIHRDITPRNIFVTDRGHAKLLDFGLAKLTAAAVDELSMTMEPTHRTTAGLALGTVAYMSPEQAAGDPLDGRTDLFSTGVVLYECATGRHPFPGKTAPVVLAAILEHAPVAPVALNPALPPRLQDVIHNCLEKDRELRYQSAGELRADLKRVRRDIESGASPIVSGAAVATSRRVAVPGTADVGSHSVAAATPSSAPSRRAALLAAGVVAIAIAAAVGYTLRAPAGPAPPAIETPRAAPTTAVTSSAVAQSASSQPPANSSAALPAAVTPAPAPTPRQATTQAARPTRGPTAPDRNGSPTPAGETVSVTPPPAAAASFTPVPSVQAPVIVPSPPPPAPVSVQATAPEPERQVRSSDAVPTPPADDDAAIRRVVATYAHAIEAKDLALFRSIKPNLSVEEQRRLENGFRAVSSQQVALTVVSIDRRRDEASVALKRRDTINASGRTQTVDSNQVLQLTRTPGGWVVVTIR